MASPFASPDHCAVAPGVCKCGKSFESALALDTHILGPELALAHHRDLAEAMEAIRVKGVEMAKEGSDGDV